MTDRYFRPSSVSAFRQLAAVTWDPPKDPTIYGAIEVDVTVLQPYIQQLRETTGFKLTVTHAAVRALAKVLGDNPSMNCLIRRGKIWQRRDVDVFCQVSVPSQDAAKQQGADLSGVIVRRADLLDTAGIAKQLHEKAARIRANDDPDLARVKGLLGAFPPLLTKYLLRFLAYLNHDWGIDLRFLGVPDDPFGSIMVTSLGMFGVRHAFAPLFPGGRSIGVFLLGEVYDKVVAENGQVVIRPVLPMQVAFDHRLIDGTQAALFSREVMRLLQDPQALDTLATVATVPEAAAPRT